MGDIADRPRLLAGQVAGASSIELLVNLPHVVAKIISHLPVLQQLLNRANALAAKAARAVRNQILQVVDANLFAIIYGSRLPQRRGPCNDCC